MNFDIGEPEKTICERLRALFAGGAGPDQMGPRIRTGEGARNEIRRWTTRLAETGYLTPGLSDGRSSVSIVVIQEQLASLAPSLFLIVEVSTRIFGRLISLYGTPEQKEAMLPGLMAGQNIGTVAVSEKTLSIQHNPLETKAVSEGPGFRVKGEKGHVLNAARADWIAVAGSIDAEPDIAFFLVPTTGEGIHIDDARATLGYEDAGIAALRLEGLVIPQSGVIRPGQGDRPLKQVRLWEDQILTAASLGLMKRAFDSAAQYAKAHLSGGKPIIAYQEVGFKLAEMLTLLQTSQLLAYRAAWMSECDDREAETLAHCAKVFCGESAEKITSEALQILGGAGYIRGNPAEAGYRDAKYLQIAGTSTEISRMEIGDALLAY